MKREQQLKSAKGREFEIAMNGAGLDRKVIENVFLKYKKLVPNWIKFIDRSFLPTPMRNSDKELILLNF